MAGINEVAAFLKEASIGYLATVDKDAPKVRPFQFQFEQDGKLWWCTGKSKEVYAQIKANPKIQFCAVKADMSYMRVSGALELVDNQAAKERIMAEQPGIKAIYGSPANPDFTTLAMSHGKAALVDSSGRVAKTIDF